MFAIGSYAALCRRVRLGKRPADVDLVGDTEEFESFKEANAEHIQEVKRFEDSPRHHLALRPGLPIEKVEFEVATNESDKYLLTMDGRDRVRLLNSLVSVPSVNVLYLTKRSHLNYPKEWEKHFSQFLNLIPLVTAFSDQELHYYKLRRREADERYKSVATRFSLNVSNEEFFQTSDHIRKYEHDDLHKAIAFNPGKPMYDRCKEDLSSAKISRAMFEALPFEERIRMPQEEFMVIGIERFFMHDRSLPASVVYARGLMKTVKDLCRGWFQDFCLDNMRALAPLPKHDFIGLFEKAERAGELRLLDKKQNKQKIQTMLRQAEVLARQGLFDPAMKLCEEILQEDQNNASALLASAVLLKAAGLLPEAEKTARRLVGRPGPVWAAWSLIGDTQMLRDAPAEAVQSYRAALKHKRDFDPARRGLAQALQRQNSTKSPLAVA